MFTVSIEILCKLPPTSVGGFRAFANVCMSIDLVTNHSYFHLFYRFPNLKRALVVFRGTESSGLSLFKAWHKRSVSLLGF